MNPTVITTGPGVIIATATASTNCRSVSQWCSLTTPPYRNGTMARPLPKTKGPGLGEEHADLPQHRPVLGRADRARRRQMVAQRRERDQRSAATFLQPA